MSEAGEVCGRPAIRGFTLVEMMIVVALIGILAGVGGAYLLVSLPSHRTDGAVRQVIGDLRLAKTLAVERGEETYVSFDTANNSYSLYLDRDGSGALSGGDDPPVKTVALEDRYKNIEFSTAVNSNAVTFPSDLAIFYPRGTANSGSVHLHPRGNDKSAHPRRERRISVIISTGRAREYRYTGTGNTWE